MKRTVIIMILCAVLALSLAGCGGTKAETTEPTEAPAATAAPTEAPAATAAPTEAPAATAEPEKADSETAALVEKILAMEGQPVEDLYALVGQPNSSDYTPSCLVTGGQDGQLEYDGFTVYTLVQPDGTETIYFCE